jgi:hypothetical protein
MIVPLTLIRRPDGVCPIPFGMHGWRRLLQPREPVMGAIYGRLFQPTPLASQQVRVPVHVRRDAHENQELQQY